MPRSLYLAHHGVKGQKHGVRQWQNKDGSLTPAGRIHYGVGAARNATSKAGKAIGRAVSKAGNAIRKKVAPTNVELNAQIRKQQSKILNRQKREELKRLKKTGRIENPSKKKIRDLTDEELNDRITRLQKEAQLASLEASRNISPGKKAVGDALLNAGSSALKEVSKDLLTKAGKKYLGLDDSDTAKARAEKYKDALSEMKAKNEYEEYKKTYKQREEDAVLKRAAERSKYRQTIINEQKAKVDLYTKKNDKKKKKNKEDE